MNSLRAVEKGSPLASPTVLKQDGRFPHCKVKNLLLTMRVQLLWLMLLSLGTVACLFPLC